MFTKHSLFSLVLALILFGSSAFAAQGQSATIHNPIIVGSYTGLQSSNSAPFDYRWITIQVTSQGPFDDTGGGTHNPWSHISGTITFLFGGGTYAFTGTVRAGGRVDLTYSAKTSSTTYTGYIHDAGDATTGPIYYLPGTYVTTTTRWFYNPFTHQWSVIRLQTDAGSFEVDANSQDD